MRSLVIKVTAPLAIIMTLVWLTFSASSALAWEVEVECRDGFVGGSIHVPEASSFDIYVEDHVPGKGWLEVPGSRDEITVAEGKEGFVPFGPLDVRAHRDGADLLKIAQTADDTPYEPFDVCDAPEPTSTTVPPTSTPSPTFTATATRAPRTATKTAVPPTATSTPWGSVGEPGLSITPEPTSTTAPAPPAIKLPAAGTGADRVAKRQVVPYMVIGFAGIFLLMAGSLRRNNRRRR
ncbi:MAG: hypothetical protein Q8P13_00800 [bacterium]|nr:hypothetical protein [bacterium]